MVIANYFSRLCRTSSPVKYDTQKEPGPLWLGYIWVSCCLVAKLWPTLCNPINYRDCPRVCSNSCPLSWWYSPTISSSAPSAFQSFPASGSFPMDRLFASGDQCIGASSAPALVLPMNVQGLFSLGLSNLILSKWLSRTFSSTTVQKYQFFSTQPSLWFSSYTCIWLLEKP